MADMNNNQQQYMQNANDYDSNFSSNQPPPPTKFDNNYTSNNYPINNQNNKNVNIDDMDMGYQSSSRPLQMSNYPKDQPGYQQPPINQFNLQ